MSLPVGAFTAAAPGIQRRLRKMSKYPREPRVLSQARICFAVGWPGTVLMAFTAIVLATADEASRPDDATIGIVCCLIMMLVFLWFLWIGYKRHFGVDEQKFWFRFVPFFYREIRYADIRKITFNGACFGVFGKRKKPIGLAINVFDLTLAYLRILEEMRVRRFTVGKIEPHDPRWPEAWQDMRNRLAAEAYRNHQNYYDSYPAELQELNALAVGRYPAGS